MRHVSENDLERLQIVHEGVASLSREYSGLRERKPGVWYLKSRAFLHFHEDSGDLYADVRLDGVEFARFKVTGHADQKALVARIKDCLSQ